MRFRPLALLGDGAHALVGEHLLDQTGRELSGVQTHANGLGTDKDVDAIVAQIILVGERIPAEGALETDLQADSLDAQRTGLDHVDCPQDGTVQRHVPLELVLVSAIAEELGVDPSSTLDA